MKKGLFKFGLVTAGAILIASFLVMAAMPAQASPLMLEDYYLVDVTAFSSPVVISTESNYTQAFNSWDSVVGVVMDVSFTADETELYGKDESGTPYQYLAWSLTGHSQSRCFVDVAGDIGSDTADDVCAVAGGAYSNATNASHLFGWLASPGVWHLATFLPVISGGSAATVSNVKLIVRRYPTPTPTATGTATFTATATATATATGTPTVSVITFAGDHNYLKDGSFESFPQLQFLGLSPWSTSWLSGTVNRQTFTGPEGWTSQQTVTPLCGGSFYQIDAPPNEYPPVGVFDHTGPYTEQGFDWPGGTMYVNMGAQTSDTNTQGFLQLQKPDSSIAVLGPDIASLNGWHMNFWQVSDAPAGHYTMQVKARTLDHSTPGHLAIDDVAIHEGYWVNDCGLPGNMWSKEDRSQNVQTATPSGPTATLSAAEMTSGAATRIFGGNGTQTVNNTATTVAQANATSTAGHQTAVVQTAVAANINNGWLTATSIARGVATLIASGNGTFVAEGHSTATAQASHLTATAVFGATSTAFVGSFRATLTAQAVKTQTAVAGFQTQNAVQAATVYAQRTLTSQHLTATAAAVLTQQAVAPINIPLTVAAAQATAQARLLATNAAILTQSAQQQLTAQAQITTTANATVFAQATQLAQLNATLQALATLQATQSIYATATAQAQTGGQGQIEMPPQQPPASSEISCIYPDNALNLAWWIDYGVCQVQWFFTLNTENLGQVEQIQEEFESSAIIQTFVLSNVQLSQIGNLLTSLDWEGSSLCRGRVFDPRSLLTITSNVLTGNLGLPFASSEEYDPTNCHTTLYATLVGPYIENGMCFTIHILCIAGVISMLQWIFDVVIIVGFVFYLYNKLQKMSGF